jgi:hypothetical protein
MELGAVHREGTKAGLGLAPTFRYLQEISAANAGASKIVSRGCTILYAQAWTTSVHSESAAGCASDRAAILTAMNRAVTGLYVQGDLGQAA